MKNLAILVLLIMSFTLIGCTQAPQTEEEEDNVVTTAEGKVEEELSGDDAPEDYQGEWTRTGTYLNGALLHTTPATLNLQKTTYSSSGTCTTVGTVDYKGDNTIAMKMESHDCPVPPGSLDTLSIVYTYKIEFDEDNDVEVMTLFVDNVMETYDRVE